jgi:signal transduction histidine kinase
MFGLVSGHRRRRGHVIPGVAAEPVAPSGVPAVARQRSAHGLTSAFALLILAVVGGLAFGVASQPTQRYLYSAVPAVTFTLLGGILTARRPRNPVSWLFVAIGLSHALEALGARFVSFRPLGWVSQWIFVFSLGLLPFTLLLFPDGRLASRRWRPVAWVAAAGLVIAAGGLSAAAWEVPSLGIDRDALLVTRPAVMAEVGLFGMVLVLTSTAAAILSLVVRWRRAGGDTRQQLKWLAAGAVLLLVSCVLDAVFFVPGVWAVSATAVPAVAAVAILKYRLYDIDLFLNRSLVYVTLTVLIVGGYTGIVRVLSGVLTAQIHVAPELVATGLLAVVFQPVREWVQRGANRLLYGDRYDPYAVVSRLGRNLEAVDPAAVLPQVAETVAEALHLPYVGIELTDGEDARVVASHGRRVIAAEALPMTYQGQVVGRLLVSPRSATQGFTAEERGLLEDLARHAGVAAHAVRLTADLQRSRQRLVRSQEEERRRLRRDLHDGLGPAMAGMTMQIGAARALLRIDADRVDDALGRLETDLEMCMVEVRRLVDDLRPPTLDQLGLVAAIHERTSAFDTGKGGSGLAVEVSAPDDLGELPAAVEVAAYRIVTEAVTNAVRHAGASRCEVRLTAPPDKMALVVEVIDDGIGLPDQHQAGVGLRSMRERAEELGGAFAAQRLPAPAGGTRIHAELPLGER